MSPLSTSPLRKIFRQFYTRMVDRLHQLTIALAKNSVDTSLVVRVDSVNLTILPFRLVVVEGLFRLRQNLCKLHQVVTSHFSHCPKHICLSTAEQLNQSHSCYKNINSPVKNFNIVLF